MKVLHANKYHFLHGGTERYYLDVMELLEKRGVKTIPFAMQHKKNLETPFSEYFVSEVDFSKVRFDKEGLRVIGRMLYSFEARQKIGALIEAEKPDVAHIHNIYHQISPSILSELKKRKVPILATLHDYKIISPDYILYSDYPKPHFTQDCKKYKYYNAVIHKTIKGSYIASALTAFEMYFHKLFQFYERHVDLFVAPSEYVKQTFVEWGQNGDKIVVLPHFVRHEEYPYSFMHDTQDPYIVYWGRHSGEKGLDYLLAAMERLPHVKLVVCGDGPDREKLEQFVVDKKMTNVEFKGFVPDDDLSRIVRDAEFVVVPSVFPETFGLVVAEGFAYGKPVIGPKRGAVPELLEDGKNGYLFKAQDVLDLVSKIDKLWNKNDLIPQMGKYAREKVETVYDPARHMDALTDFYEELIQKKKK